MADTPAPAGKLTRPSETTTGATGVALAAAAVAFHWSSEQAAAAIAGVGLLGGLVTYVVNNGGLKGIWHRILG